MNIAVITGASSGLGVCYVEAVIKLFPGIKELWLVARREERLKEVAKKYPDKHFEIIPMDMMKMENFKMLENKLKEKDPQIQVFIHDAGNSIGGSFEDMKLEDMLQMIDLNCKGATAITKVCLPYIIDGGTILEVSSTSAFVPNTNLIVYSATKSYVSALCLGLKEELKRRYINVCAVCPGFMLTEMTCSEQSERQSRLPVIDPKKAAFKSLKAAKQGKAVYTTGVFYKIYRFLTKLVPHTVLVKFVGLG